MWVWEQSSQAATWPPSAAVLILSSTKEAGLDRRHDLELAEAQVARPWRQAGPWARRISATSRLPLGTPRRIRRAPGVLSSATPAGS